MRLLFISAIFILHTLAAYPQSKTDRGYLVQVGQKAPDIQLRLIDGSRLSLNELKGKVVVLQFTASWCSVCRKEMPHLESEIWNVFKNKDFLLIGVDYDEPLEKVKTFKREMKVSYPFALDPGAAIFHQFAKQGAGVTRNVVIDQQGNIVFLTRLYNRPEFEAMKAKIAQLLQKK